MNAINYNATAPIRAAETIEVSKKDGNKRVPVGSVTVFIPTLADLGVSYPAGNLVGAWADKALRAAALADARNKLVSGTADLKPGAKLACTLEELAAPAENSGEALKQISELKKAFAAYLEALKLSTKAVAFLRGCFDSPKSLALQPPEVVDKVVARVSDFVESVGGVEALTPVQTAYLERLVDGSGSDDELDLDDL